MPLRLLNLKIMDRLELPRIFVFKGFSVIYSVLIPFGQDILIGVGGNERKFCAGFKFVQ